MISAATGGSVKVMGSSMAMVATGPSPGSTPTSVPSSAPIRQNSRFCGVAATPKPNHRFWRRSLTPPLPRPHGKRQQQGLDEQEPGEEREYGAEHDGRAPPVLGRRDIGNRDRC